MTKDQVLKAIRLIPRSEYPVLMRLARYNKHRFDNLVKGKTSRVSDVDLARLANAIIAVRNDVKKKLNDIDIDKE